MPTVALELWMEKEAAMPARKPSSGRSARVRKSLPKASLSARGVTAAVMFTRPVKRMPKPITMVPTR